MTTVNDIIRDNIQELLNQKSMTHSDLSSETRIPVKIISGLIGGSKTPTAPELQAISKALEVRIADLATQSLTRPQDPLQRLVDESTPDFASTYSAISEVIDLINLHADIYQNSQSQSVPYEQPTEEEDRGE